MDIKPIPTRYKGYHMRSRTEARWGVFFDALGVEWRYELEGFELPSGRRYLPDFYLPEQEAFVEVKREGFATDPSPAEAVAAIRAAEFAGADGAQFARTLLTLAGTPGHGSYLAVAMIEGYDSDDVMEGRLACGRRLTRELWIEVPGAGSSTIGRGVCKEDDFKHPVSSGNPIDGAYAAARSARFEFGESGAT